MGFLDTDQHSEQHGEHDNAYNKNSHSGLFNFEGGSGTLAIFLIASVTAIPVAVCLWRWVKRDRIRLRAQYPVAYARYKSERKEIRELIFNHKDGTQAFRAQSRDIRDECTIEWACAGALEHKPDKPCDPAFWEGPNKEAKANREGGKSKSLRSPKAARPVAPRPVPYARPDRPPTRNVATQVGGNNNWAERGAKLGCLVKELTELVIVAKTPKAGGRATQAGAGATTWTGSPGRRGALPPWLARSASTSSVPPRSVTGTEGHWFQVLRLKSSYKAVHIGQSLAKEDFARLFFAYAE